MKKGLVLIGFLLCSIVAAYAQDVKFTVAAPRVVNVGEQFRVTFSVNAGADQFTGPDFGDFQVLAGPSKSTSQSFQIINGQTSHSQTTSFVYILYAAKEGNVSVGKASVVADNKTYQTQPFSIEIVKGEAPAQNQQTQQGQATGQAQAATANAGDAFVRVVVSKSNVYRGEYLTATVKLYTQNLNIAGFEDIKFPTFNGFWSQEVEAPQQLNFQRENVNGKIYNAAVIRRYVLFPQQTGALKIDPFEITCVMQVQSTAQNMFDAFFSQPQIVRKKLVSPVSVVNAQALPANAPASFAGAVGTGFRMDASLSRDTVTANEAMALTIKITGEGNVKLVEAPKVAFPPDFETYDAKITDNSKTSSAGVSGTKQFELPFIPRSAGNFTIDPIEFTYFDINKKQYVTMSSKAMPIRVGKDPNAGSAVTVAGVNRQAVQSLGEDVRYIKTELPQWKEKDSVFFGSLIYYLLLLVEIIVFVVVYLFLAKRRKESQNVVLIRNKKANKMARRRLKAADHLLKSGNQSGFYEELTKALWGYLSDKLSIAVADLSRENIRGILQGKQLSDDDIALFLQTVDECEFARYAPSGGQGQMQKVYDDAMAAISKYEQLLK